jgi:hypothetical protein
MNQSKAGIGEAVTAYVEVEQAAGARALREDLFTAARPAAEEHAGLLQIEDALEAAVLAALEGKKGDAGKDLKALRARLKL